MNIVQLDQAIRAVCPHIHGVNSDGVISFIDEATQEQRDAAQAVVNSAVITDEPDFDQEAAFARLRAYRTPLLDALSGIAGRLARANQPEDAAAADAAAQALLDLPTDPIILAATDDESFDDAALLRYRQIAAACPPSVQSAFKEAV